MAKDTKTIGQIIGSRMRQQRQTLGLTQEAPNTSRTAPAQGTQYGAHRDDHQGEDEGKCEGAT